MPRVKPRKLEAQLIDEETERDNKFGMTVELNNIASSGIKSLNQSLNDRKGSSIINHIVIIQPSLALPKKKL